LGPSAASRARAALAVRPLVRLPSLVAGLACFAFSVLTKSSAIVQRGPLKWPTGTQFCQPNTQQGSNHRSVHRFGAAQTEERLMLSARWLAGLFRLSLLVTTRTRLRLPLRRPGAGRRRWLHALCARIALRDWTNGPRLAWLRGNRLRAHTRTPLWAIVVGILLLPPGPLRIERLGAIVIVPIVSEGERHYHDPNR